MLHNQVRKRYFYSVASQALNLHLGSKCMAHHSTLPSTSQQLTSHTVFLNNLKYIEVAAKCPLVISICNRVYGKSYWGGAGGGGRGSELKKAHVYIPAILMCGQISKHFL